MGKIFIFIIAAVCVLSGCSNALTKADNSGAKKNYEIPPEEKEYKDKAFKIALLMRKFTDEFVSAKYDRRLPLVTDDKERGIKRVETYYVVESKRGEEMLSPRFMYLQIVIQDDEDPGEIGISSMMFSPEIWEITMDDSNIGYYLWIDNPLWADYVDPDEVMSSESESR